MKFCDILILLLFFWILTHKKCFFDTNTLNFESNMPQHSHHQVSILIVPA